MVDGKIIGNYLIIYLISVTNHKKGCYIFKHILFLIVQKIVPILAVKLKMINKDRIIFGDFSVNSKPISCKFCKGHFLFKS